MSWWFSIWHFGVQTHLGCDMDGSQRGLGATYWVLSLPILIHIVLHSSSMFFSLFTRGLIFPGLSHIFVHMFPHVSSICFVCSGLRICLKRCQAGWGCCVLHHTTFLESWDTLGRFGTAWDGSGRLRKIRRTVWDQSKWKTLKTVQGTRCYCSVIVDGFIEHRQTKQGWTGTINKPATNLSARRASFEYSAPSGQFHLPR